MKKHRGASEKFEFPFEKLEVWQAAVDMAEAVIRLLSDLPPNKHYRLIDQMEAASTSVAQNIAEGKGRQHKKEFIQYLHIAQGSLYEVVTLIEVFKRNQLFGTEDSLALRHRCETIDRKLNGLINFLKGKKREGNRGPTGRERIDP